MPTHNWGWVLLSIDRSKQTPDCHAGMMDSMRAEKSSLPPNNATNSTDGTFNSLYLSWRGMAHPSSGFPFSILNKQCRL